MARNKVSATFQGRQLGIDETLTKEIRESENATGLDAFLKEAKRKSQIIGLNVSLAIKLDDYGETIRAIEAMGAAARALDSDVKAIVKKLGMDG